MKLICLKIINYRNLNNQEIRFNPSINFIVGENNLGKSNLLLLLNTLFRNTYRTNFDLEDFTDPNLPLEVTFSLSLDDIEIGLFDDLFDSDEPNNQITIRATQAVPDDYLEYWHDETNQKISPSTIKCINYLYYDSQRSPDKELTFDKSKGVGRFLNHLVQRYLVRGEIGDLDFVDTTKVAELIAEINTTLSKLKAFRDYNINATLEQGIEDLLSKLLLLKDEENRQLSQSGYGVQFLTVISLFILERLLSIGKIKSKKGIFGTIDKKSISLVIGLDEPEIHLHPFLQRSLIKYIQRIIQNRDSDFLEVLKEAFGFDSFMGQSIIATHSPSILLNDYTEIIRLYIQGGSLHIKSGMDIHLDPGLHKHLQMQFPFIKEAFFSRCVIVVEGESEISAFPYFALKIDPTFDFDDLGISVIKASGKGSVEPIIKLLGEFDIPCIGIIDRDQIKTSPNPSIKMTNAIDFEAELISLIDLAREDILIQLLTTYDNLGVERILDKKALSKRLLKYSSIIGNSFTITESIKYSEIDADDQMLKKLWFLTWLSINKNILLGAHIGEILPSELIPPIYIEVVSEAVHLSKQQTHV